MKKPGILGEFKEFVMRGNVMDLAVGVMIGAAFQKIVTSMINDLLMPLVGLITGDANFNDQFFILRLPEGVDRAQVTSLDVAKELGVTTLNYGSFLTIVLDFLIMALVIFLLVKGVNSLNRRLSAGHKEPTPPPAPTTKLCPYCRSEVAKEATRCPHCTSVLDDET